MDLKQLSLIILIMITGGIPTFLLFNGTLFDNNASRSLCIFGICMAFIVFTIGTFIKLPEGG
jgi:hypothetical protein